MQFGTLLPSISFFLLFLYREWGLFAALIVAAPLFLVWWIWASSGMKARRKLQLATWTAPSEGVIHSKFSVDATNILQYMKELEEKSGEKVTITSICGKVIALALKECPSLNGRILYDRFIPNETIDLSFLVALEGGQNLAKVKIERCNEKSVLEIGRLLHKQASSIREGKDENFQKTMGPLQILPTWMIRPIAHTSGWLTGVLGISIPALGLEPFPFGTCIITSVGMLGVQEAWAPFTPFTRVPIIVLIGQVHDSCVPLDGKVVVRPKLKLMATLDHRFLDGAQAKGMGDKLRECFNDPWKYL